MKAIIALAVLLAAASIAQTAPSLTAAWEAANGPYKKAMHATSLGKAEEGLAQIQEFRAAWDALAARYGARPPQPYARDRQWAGDLKQVAAWIDRAGKEAQSGDLHTSHETLEQIRLRWLAMRVRGKVDHFGDHLTRFHAPMERVALAVKGRTPDALSAANLEAIRAAAPELARLFRPIERFPTAGLDPERAEERSRLVQALGEHVRALELAAAAGNRPEILVAGSRLKPAFAALYLKFG